MNKHSKLSPSSAHRWLECTASVDAIVQADLPETTSDAAEEGHRAHELAEICLTQNIAPLLYEGDREYDDEMRGHIEEYVNYIKKFHFFLKGYEIKLPLFYSLEDTGTADVIGLCAKELHIIDLKYGQGVFVEIKDNPQLIIYAISALRMYSTFTEIENVVIHVFQPRMANIACCSYSLEELKVHENNIFKQAAITLTPTAQFKPSEHTCHFCAFKPQCGALEKHLTEVLSPYFTNLEESKLITDEKMRRVLDNKKLIIGWIKEIETHVLTILQTGGSFKGYKVVKGKGSKSWGSIENLLALLQNEAYEQKILSPAKFKKFVNKHKGKVNLERVKTVERDIIRQEGKEILVPMSHEKEAIEFVGFKKFKEYEAEKQP